MNLIMKVLNCLSRKGIVVRFNKKVMFALVYFVMKITWFILFIYEMKNLKTMGLMFITCLYQTI